MNDAARGRAVESTDCMTAMFFSAEENSGREGSRSDMVDDTLAGRLACKI